MRAWIVLVTLTVAAPASATLIISGDGTETCMFAGALGSGACSFEPIDLHPAWQPNDPHGNGAVWESYAQTGGATPAVLAPNDPTSPIMIVTEMFFASAGSMLWLDVWADDTAEVFIDSISVFAPNFSLNICANGAIGCEPGEQGMIHHTFLSSGIHTIDIAVYQLGGGPFGVLYSGNLRDSRVPEPATLALLGFGALAFGFSRRRR